MKVIKDIIKKCSECPYYIDQIYMTGFKENSIERTCMVCGKTNELKPIIDGSKILDLCPLEDCKEADHETPD